MDYFGVIGNPISHSLSPRIHELFAEQTSQELAYEALLADLDAFEFTVEAFRKTGGKGLNVTLPFKGQAWEYATDRAARADRVKAVNVLRFDAGGQVHGDSTDGLGLLRDLAGNGLEPKGRRVLLLGAGGAARSVLGDLMDAAPASITIANRSLARARDLAALFPEGGQRLAARGFDELAGQSYELIINATSAGLAGEQLPLPEGLLAVGGGCYDLAYGAGATPFLDWARRNGAAKSCDGLGMLVEQAAESFYLWRGVRPRAAPVINALREEQAR